MSSDARDRPSSPTLAATAHEAAALHPATWPELVAAISRDPAVADLILVPSRLWEWHVRRQLALELGCAFGQRIMTVADLAVWIAEDGMLDRGLLPTTAGFETGIARDALLQPLDPDPFGERGRHQPGSALRLAQTIHDLRLGDIEPATLRTRAAEVDGYHSSVAFALAALLERTNDARAAAQLHDTADLLHAAIAHVEAGGTAPETLNSVSAIGVLDLSPLEHRLLRAIAATAPPDRRFAIPHPFAHTPDRANSSALAALHRGFHARNDDRPSDHVPNPDAAANGYDHTLRLLPCVGTSHEAREAVRHLLRCAHDGIPWSRMAVLVPADATYGDAVRLAIDLADAEIPLDDHAPPALATTPAGAAALALAELAGGPLPAADLFELAAEGLLASPARLLDAADDETAPTWRQLQRVARRACVVDGPHWDERLTPAYIASCTTGRRETDNTGATSHGQDETPPAATAPPPSDPTIERAATLRRLATDLRGDLAQLTNPQSFSTWAATLAALCRRWLAPRLEGLEPLLAVLETGTGGDATIPLSEARRLLRELLTSAPAPTEGTPGGVLLAPFEAAAGLPFDAVCILGVAERLLPAPPAPDPLLPDVLRERLGLPISRRRTDRHRDLFEAATAAATSGLALAYPARDPVEGRVRVRSSLVLDLEERAFGRTLDEPEHPIPVLPRGGAEALHASEHLVARALVAPESARADILARTPFLESPLRLAACRRAPTLGPHDGIVPPELAAQAIDTLVGDRWSPSKLEAYATCPLGFLLEHLLRLRPLDEPARQRVPDALAFGSAVHRTLETWLSQWHGHTLADTLADPALDTRLDTAVAGALDEMERTAPLSTPARRAQLHSLLKTELHSWIEACAQRPVSSTIHATELAFGGDGDTLPPVELTLPSGATVHLQGRIDRVDRHATGEPDTPTALHLVDYKSGAGAGLSAKKLDDRLNHGLALQLGCYAVAAGRLLGAPVHSFAYEHLAILQGSSQPKAAHLDWDDGRERELLEMLDGLLQAARAGFFAPGPSCSCGDSKVLCAWGGSRVAATEGDPAWRGYLDAVGLAPGDPEAER